MTRAQLIRTPETSNGVVPYQGGWGGVQPYYELKQESASSVRYGALLRRHKRSILVILFSCLIASLLVTFFMPPSFKAKAVVEILGENDDFLNGRAVNPNVASSSADSFLETQTRLLKSETVSDRVSAALLASKAVYDQPASYFAKLGEWVGLRAAPQPALDSDIKTTLSNLEVKPQGQSSLIAITVFGPSAQLAADTANAVANQHIAALQDARWAQANQTTDFLTLQLSAMRTKLKQSDDDLQAYARRTGLIFTTGRDRDSVGAEKLREVQADLQKAESDRADKQAQMELIGTSSADALPKVLDDGALREAKSRLSDLRRQMADLSSLYTPNHYKVQAIRDQIAAVEEQVKQEGSTVVSRVRNDYRAAVRREAIQRQQYDQQLALVTDQSAKEVNYNILKREADANRDLYQSMLQRIKEASVVAALRASNIRIVDRAKPATHPSQPNIWINTGIGLLTGCMFSALFVLMRERGDGSFRTAGQLMKTLQLPELAVVPSARQDIRTQIVSASRNGRQHLGGLFGKHLTGSPEDRSKDLVASWRNTGSVVAESYRSAVASIILWGRDTIEPHKMLVVTSAHSNAGKTTSVLNLGLGLVETGRRVLLIDGDLRLPRLGEIFGLEKSSGLTNILAEGLHPSVASELIFETGLPGLDVLPSGPRYANVTELLHSDKLTGLFEYWKLQYDFILIDSPPALPLTDARLLAQYADGVVLVVRAGATTVEQSLAVQQCFLQDGSHIFGAILNHWDAKAEDPAYMTSYLKYAAAPGYGSGRPRMEAAEKKRSTAAGD